MWTALAALIGIGLGTWIVLDEGWDAVVGVLDIAGWSLLWLIPLHLVSVILDARGWQLLLRPADPQRRASMPFVTWIAAIREAVDRLLPVANVGGSVVGIHLALLKPLSATGVTASVLVEVLLTIVNQFLFTAVGLALLVLLQPNAQLDRDLALGLLASIPVPLLLYLLLRNGKIFERGKRAIVRLFGSRHRLATHLGNSAKTLDQDLRHLLDRSGLLTRALGWQLAGMAFGGVETAVALALLGHPVTAWEALTLESLALAVRSFAFFIPAGLGVQEAGFVIFGGLLGIPTDVAVALSLSRRLRDVGFGVPALASWMWLEKAQSRKRR